MDSNLTIRQPHLMNSATSMTTFFEYTVSLFLTMLLGKIMLSSNPKKKIIKFSGILREHATSIFMIIREKLTKKKEKEKEGEIEILKQRMETSLKDIGIRTEESLGDVESRIVFLIDKERKERNQNFSDVDSKIAFLFEEEHREKNKSLEPILKRIVFLERIPKYVAWIGVPYVKENHIPVEDLVKIMANLIVPSSVLAYYLQERWMGWLTHASENDLLQFCVSVAQMPLRLGQGLDIYCITILQGIQLYGGIAEYAGQKGYNDIYSYHKKMNVFKTKRDNLPGMEKSFAVGYFERVERVLNVLYEKKLLD